jgi:hypothetical protein
MSFYSKIRGTVETLFQLGLDGPQLKSNANTIEHRNSTDAAFVRTRAADPTGYDDLATRRHTEQQDFVTAFMFMGN